jgi:IS5 family transposase
MTDDFFCFRLEQMIDMKHPLAVLGRRLPWRQIEAALSPVFARKSRKGQAIAGNDLYGSTLELAGAGVSAAGRPRLPIRLMASLLYLQHTYNLSDEEVVARWSENVVWQYFSGQAYYTPKPPCDATQIRRFRTTIGEAGVETLLKATIDTAVQTKAVPPTEFERIIVDTTVQDWNAPNVSMRNSPRTRTSATPCMPRKSNASAKVAHANPTNSVSRPGLSSLTKAV